MLVLLLLLLLLPILELFLEVIVDHGCWLSAFLPDFYGLGLHVQLRLYMEVVAGFCQHLAYLLLLTVYLSLFLELQKPYIVVCCLILLENSYSFWTAWPFANSINRLSISLATAAFKEIKSVVVLLQFKLVIWRQNILSMLDWTGSWLLIIWWADKLSSAVHILLSLNLLLCA